MDNHGTDALERCQGASRSVASSPREVGSQTKTLQRSESQRITARHGESQSITEIMEHHGHHGARHWESWSGAHHGRSQHR